MAPDRAICRGVRLRTATMSGEAAPPAQMGRLGVNRCSLSRPWRQRCPTPVDVDRRRTGPDRTGDRHRRAHAKVVWKLHTEINAWPKMAARHQRCAPSKSPLAQRGIISVGHPRRGHHVDGLRDRRRLPHTVGRRRERHHWDSRVDLHRNTKRCVRGHDGRVPGPSLVIPFAADIANMQVLLDQALQSWLRAAQGGRPKLAEGGAHVTGLRSCASASVSPRELIPPRCWARPPTASSFTLGE